MSKAAGEGRIRGRPAGLYQVSVGNREWMRQAECDGVADEVMFPSRGESADPAREICRRCPVISECSAYALELRIKHGVWGGQTARERARSLRRSA